MKIKICGMKTAEASIAACAAGADMLGFNFFPRSARYITTAECRRIVALVQRNFPDVILVGVFVNTPVAEVQETLDMCGLHLAQLAGDEHINDYAALGERAFKALRSRTAVELEQAVAQLPARSAPAYLLDAYQGAAYGGSGETGDWALARHAAERHPILLAGGLRPHNVAEAVRQVRPWGVDVASGVESKRGEKDVHLIGAFIHAARSAHLALQGETP